MTVYSRHNVDSPMAVAVCTPKKAAAWRGVSVAMAVTHRPPGLCSYSPAATPWVGHTRLCATRSLAATANSEVCISSLAAGQVRLSGAFATGGFATSA